MKLSVVTVNYRSWSHLEAALIELHKRMGAAARQRVLTEFTIEKTAREIISVYRDLSD